MSGEIITLNHPKFPTPFEDSGRATQPFRLLVWLAAVLLAVSSHAAVAAGARGDNGPSVNAGLAMLSNLGLGAGLWDKVENRKPLRAEDREPFYQLLHTVGKIETQEVIRRAQQSLGRATSSVVPLFNEPDTQFGQFVVLEGTARRAVKIFVGPAEELQREGEARAEPQRGNDILARYGIDHYYEMDIVTADSQHHPIVFCVRRLPQGFPEGENIHEPVRAAGFFFKVWAYHARTDAQKPADAQGAPKRQWELAPLVIGPGVQWLRARESPGGSFAGMIAGTLFALAIVGAWMLVWTYRRGDRQFARRMRTLREENEQTCSLNQLEIDGGP